jgi:hypothetical protein
MLLVILCSRNLLMTLLSAKFKDLVATEMEETAGRFNKKIMQKKKEARGRPLWNELKTKVDVACYTRSILSFLGNDSMSSVLNSNSV